MNYELKTKLKACSFFTGAGGFDLGFEEAGIEVVFQCEKDKFCLELLNKYYPEVLKSEDISTLTPREIPEADIYFGGFPCQDASVAGQRKGLAGEKTGLFYEFIRLIKANQPTWIVLENVPGLLFSGGRADFKLVIETLANCGYYLSWRVLDSQYFGLPQRRKRLFIVGHRTNWQYPCQVLLEPELENQIESSEKNPPCDRTSASSLNLEPILAFETSFCGRDRPFRAQPVSPTLTTRCRTGLVVDGELRKPTPLECERLQGFPDNWTEGFSDTVRYRMAGNAVSVPVAEWIGRRMLNVEC